MNITNNKYLTKFRPKQNFNKLALITTLASLTMGVYATPMTTSDTQLNQSQHHSQHQSAILTPSSITDTLIAQARQQNLATHRTWLRLHYYEHKGADNYHSKVDNPDFFVSPQGSDNPQAELEAFIVALTRGDATSQTLRCQFPARVHWLTSQLNIENGGRLADCPEFTAWINKLDPQRLSIVFAEEYPDRPVSSFGHTVMLIDSTASLNDATAINEAYALNYTVDGDPDDSIVVYALKSLFGSYPNEITIDIYPEKLADYIQEDNRDTWVYPIDLSVAEVQQIMRHVWETKDLALPYYLTKDNCASEILRYIDVVRPEGSLVDEFNFAVVPSSVVRLLAENGLLTEQHYIAANKTLTQAKQNNYNTKLPSSALSADNTLIPSDITADNNNPINAHDLQQASIGIGHQGNSSYLSLNYRYGFNDLLNIPDGYPQNFNMQVLGANLRVYEDDDNLQYDTVEINDIILVKGRSFNPVNTAYRGTTWGVDLGAHRVQDGSIDAKSSKDNTDINQSHLVANVGYERGVSVAFGTPKAGTGALPPHLCYAMGGGTAQVGKGIGNGYRLGVSVNLGCRYMISDNARMTGEIQLPYWYHGSLNAQDTKDGYFQPILSIQAQYDIDKNQAIRIQGSYQLQDRIKDKEDIQLAYVRHF